MKKILIAVFLAFSIGTVYAQTDSAQVPRTQLKNNRYVPVYGTFYSWMVTEQGNLYFTNERARAAVSALSPLSYNPTTGAFSLSGLSGLGTANQLPGMNAGGTGFEWKTLAGGSIISISHGVGSLTIGINANSIGTGQIGTAGVGTDELGDSVVTSRKIPLGNVVRSIEGLFDDIFVGGENGASVRTASGPTGDSIIVSGGVSGGDSAGIFALQSTDLDVTNPNGPTTTINIKSGGVTNGKLGANAVTTDKVQDGTLLTGDFNATAKAPLAGTADSAGKAGLAANATHAVAADSAGKVKVSSIGSPELIDGSITTPDFNAAAKAPLAGTADSAINTGHATSADSAGKVKSTGVTPTVYGNGSNVFQGTLNAGGQVTAASNVPIAITGANVNDGTLTGADVQNQSLMPADIDTSASGMATQSDLPIFVSGYYRAGMDSVVVPVSGMTAGRKLGVSWTNAGAGNFGVLSVFARTDSVGVYSNWVETIDSLMFTILIKGNTP